MKKYFLNRVTNFGLILLFLSLFIFVYLILNNTISLIAVGGILLASFLLFKTNFGLDTAETYERLQNNEKDAIIRHKLETGEGFHFFCDREAVRQYLKEKERSRK